MTSRRTHDSPNAARALLAGALLTLWALGCDEPAGSVDAFSEPADGVVDVGDAAKLDAGADVGDAARPDTGDVSSLDAVSLGLVAEDVAPYIARYLPEDVPYPQCRPGEMAECACFDGRPGQQPCGSGGRFEACSCPPPRTPDRTTPRLVSPRTHLRMSSQRPTVSWLPPAGTARSRVELCADRPCIRSLVRAEVSATSWRPERPLTAGMVFWRVTALDAAGATLWQSPTWLMYIRRRDAAADTALDRPVDFNGDGYDDLLVERWHDASYELYLYPGSEEGLVASRRVRVNHPDPAMAGEGFVLGDDRLGNQLVGDLNGDGYTDVLGYVLTPHYVGTILFGGPGPLFGRYATFQTMGEPSADLPEHERGALEDVNGDGFLDRVTFLGRVLWGGASGLSSTYTESVLGALDRGEDTYGFGRYNTDFDADGYPDIWGSYPVTWYGAASLRFVRTPGAPSPHEEEGAPTVGDFNGDRHTDLVRPRETGWAIRPAYGSPIGVAQGTLLELFSGAGDFRARGMQPAPKLLSHSGDLNGDGLSDVVVVFPPALPPSDTSFEPCLNQGWLYRFDGHPDGLSLFPSRLMRGSCAGLFYGAEDVGDYNGDGFDDIILYHAIGRGDDDDGLSAAEARRDWTYQVVEGRADDQWGLTLRVATRVEQGFAVVR